MSPKGDVTVLLRYQALTTKEQQNKEKDGSGEYWKQGVYYFIKPLLELIV